MVSEGLLSPDWEEWRRGKGEEKLQLEFCFRTEIQSTGSWETENGEGLFLLWLICERLSLLDK
ncbi:hypothetical protein STEG23_023566, partial [Scotinomys teguina]